MADSKKDKEDGPVDLTKSKFSIDFLLENSPSNAGQTLVPHFLKAGFTGRPAMAERLSRSGTFLCCHTYCLTNVLTICNSHKTEKIFFVTAYSSSWYVFRINEPTTNPLLH